MAFFAVCNIRSVPRMPTAKVRQDLDRLLGSWLAGRGAVIGLSEITPSDYKNAVRAAAPRWGWGMYGVREENPILWDLRKFEYYPAGGCGRVRMHDGLKFVSPHRTFVWIALREVGTNRVFIFIATHFVSGAWTTLKRSFKPWRKARWDESWRDLNQFIDSKTAEGFMVVRVGDFNKGEVAAFSPGEVNLLGKAAGIMSVSYVDGTFVKGNHTGTPVVRLNGTQNGGPLNTDHPAWGRRVDLTRVGEVVGGGSTGPSGPTPMEPPAEDNTDPIFDGEGVFNDDPGWT